MKKLIRWYFLVRDKITNITSFTVTLMTCGNITCKGQY